MDDKVLNKTRVANDAVEKAYRDRSLDHPEDAEFKASWCSLGCRREKRFRSSTRPSRLIFEEQASLETS